MNILEVWINTIWIVVGTKHSLSIIGQLRGDLWDRLRDKSSNDNVQALLRSIPVDGRPGFFWTKLMNEPLVFAFPGVKVARLIDYPLFFWSQGSVVCGVCEVLSFRG